MLTQKRRNATIIVVNLAGGWYWRLTLDWTRNGDAAKLFCYETNQNTGKLRKVKRVTHVRTQIVVPGRQ